MNGPLLVGLAGRKRSGKSTVAWRLAAAHGYCLIAFADPLKAVLLDVDPRLQSGMGLREAVARYGWEEVKDTQPEARSMLQRLGAAVREHAGDTVWVDEAMRRVARAQGHGWDTVVADVRYPNEAAAIRSAGGTICWVDRPDLPDDGDRHPSETSITPGDCDLILANHGTVDDLWRVADNLAGMLSRYDLVG